MKWNEQTLGKSKFLFLFFERRNFLSYCWCHLVDLVSLMASIACIVAHSIPSQMFCIIKLTPKTCCVDRFMHENKIPMGNLRKCYIKILGFLFLLYFLFSQMFHLDYGPVIYGDHCATNVCRQTFAICIFSFLFSFPIDLRNKSNPPPWSWKSLATI